MVEFGFGLGMAEFRTLKKWQVVNFELRKAGKIFLSNSFMKEAKMTPKENFDFHLTSFSTLL